jgi:hypothetical protein
MAEIADTVEAVTCATHTHTPNRAEPSRVSRSGVSLTTHNHDRRFRVRLPILCREIMRFSARSPSPSPMRRCVFLDLYNQCLKKFL